MEIRRLNAQGISKFAEFLDWVDCETPPPYPSDLLTDPRFTEEVNPPTEIENREFGTRRAAAEYLFNVFKNAGLTDIEKDPGLWAWLSLFYFDQLCPSDKKGHRKPGEKARWIPERTASWRRYYRHLLGGPYRIYAAHLDNPDRAMLVLCGPLYAPGDIVEQTASRQEIITNTAIMEAATALYYDVSSGKPKWGAASKKEGGGNFRRFVSILDQFDVTWDLYSLNTHDFIQMLPDEFSRFREAS